MPSRKRNLEKVEQRVANAPDAPDEPHGAAADYLRDLIAKAERGELKGKPATDEKRSKTWLEAEVEKVANRLTHRAQSEGANRTVRRERTQPEANQTGADDELPEELLSKLLRKLASDKVH